MDPSSSTPPWSSGPAYAPETTLVLFTVELGCLLCGRSIGELIAEQWPTTRPVWLRPVGSDRPRRISGWWHMRCAACGGRAIATEVGRQRIRLEPAVDWQAERRRPGRPPTRGF